MKRIILFIFVSFTSFSSLADQAFHPAGENLTYGNVATFQSLIGNTNNPATGASAYDLDGWYFGFGLVSSVGAGAEVGPVKNFVDQLNDLSDTLNNFGKDGKTPSTGEIEEIKTKFDDFLVVSGESGYAKISLAATVPLFPFMWSSRNFGSLVFDVNGAAQAQVSVLDRPIEYNPLEQGLNILQTNTALYIKAGGIGQASMAYSRQIFKSRKGALIAGLKTNYYIVKLRKTLFGLAQVDDVDEAIKDEVEEVRKDISSHEAKLGFDLGLMWVAQKFRIGATFKNLNSPEFKYPDVGTDCSAKTAGTSQDSCYIAQSFADEIDLQETHVMDAQVQVEAAAHNKSRNLVAAFAVDTSPVNDLVGNQIQWLTGSLAYATRSWIIPGIRVGYRKNLAGSKLSAITGGLTLFKTLHVDAAYGLEKIEVDGASAPRMAQVNIGIDILF